MTIVMNTTISRTKINNYNLDIMTVPGYLIVFVIFILLCLARWQRLDTCQVFSNRLYGKNMDGGVNDPITNSNDDSI